MINDVCLCVTGSSAPLVDPDSPLSVGLSSTATSVSEVDELLGDLYPLDTVDPSMDGDLAYISDTLQTMSNTVSIFSKLGGKHM